MMKQSDDCLSFFNKISENSTISKYEKHEALPTSNFPHNSQVVQVIFITSSLCSTHVLLVAVMPTSLSLEREVHNM